MKTPLTKTCPDFTLARPPGDEGFSKGERGKISLLANRRKPSSNPRLTPPFYFARVKTKRQARKGNTPKSPVFAMSRPLIRAKNLFTYAHLTLASPVIN